MGYRILKAAFALWVVLWAAFLARELFVKDNIGDYAALISRDLEGKRSYVTGDRLYAFLGHCREAMPVSASYRIAGVDEGAIERRRAVYYLYPSMEENDPDFIIDLARYTLTKVKE